MNSSLNLARLRDFTPARVALGRAGHSLPTRELLELQLAHARARDAVHAKLDPHALALDLKPVCGECLLARSAAPDRFTYLRRPDLGRRLSEDSRRLLAARKGDFDAAFLIADGLSALAIERHARPMLETILGMLDARDWKLAPAVIVQQGRVAIGDDAGCCLGAALSVVFIGERPGLSSPDSLGIYLTWNPRPGLTDANRNCISNIRAEGLSYEAAARLLAFLMTESRRRKVSGIEINLNPPLAEPSHTAVSSNNQG
jgi:ethanolamine ammonia-lyase small subunit